MNSRGVQTNTQCRQRPEITHSIQHDVAVLINPVRDFNTRLRKIQGHEDQVALKQIEIKVGECAARLLGTLLLR